MSPEALSFVGILAISGLILLIIVCFWEWRDDHLDELSKPNKQLMKEVRRHSEDDNDAADNHSS